MSTAVFEPFTEQLRTLPLLDEARRAALDALQEHFPKARLLAQELLRRDWLTPYQIQQLFANDGHELVLGNYIVLNKIGEGGMGQVFKARHRTTERIVALKVLRRECLENRNLVARFRREIELAARLQHPHIVRAYDADTADGRYFIVLEYVEGVDLARLVKRHGPLTITQACAYGWQAALGLQHAFERGLVHRDIKPANLLVSRNRQEVSPWGL